MVERTPRHANAVSSVLAVAAVDFPTATSVIFCCIHPISRGGDMARKQRPFPTARVRKMKPIRAKLAPPEPESRTIQSVFFDADRTTTPSAAVEIAPIARRKGKTTWQVDLHAKAPVDARFSLAPRAEEHIATRAIRKRARTFGELEPLRPAWVDQRFIPQQAPRTRRRRLFHRGREVEPFILFSPDGRRVYNDPTYPWRCVGLVSSGSTPRGSGVLIGPRHVLTASHVIDWSNLATNFKAHLFDNSHVGSSFAAGVWRYEKITDVDSENVEEDYAVIVLNQELGDQLGYLGAKEYDDDWDGGSYWQSIGYASDLGGADRPIFQDDIVLEEFDGGDMMVMSTTNGDFASGQSGSPVFGWWTQGPYAVGVVSGAGQDMNLIAGGEAMVDLVKTARLLTP
jgi:V8-like Glu-specific endopeptidase